MNVHVTKTIPIEFKWVVDAYAKVKQGIVDLITQKKGGD